MRQKIIVFIVIQLIFTISPGSSAGVDIFSSSPIGPYKFVIKQVYNCNPLPTNKIQHHIYLSHMDNTTYLLGNTTMEIPFDDTFFLEVKMSFRQSSGNWKENVVTQKWPMACSTYKKILGNQWTAFMHGMGIQNTECPVLPGIYIAPGVDTSIAMKTNLPKTFFYGTYKLHLYYSRKNEIFGCQVYILEFKRP